MQELLEQVLRRNELKCDDQFPALPTNLAASSPVLAEAESYFAEDRYWPQGDDHGRGNKLQTYQQFRKIERAHKKWVQYHMDEGIPTFFSLLSVEQNVDEARLDEVYAYKREYSSFPEDIIEEAYRTLKNPKLRLTYIQFLKVFRDYYGGVAPPEYRAGLEKCHACKQNLEKQTILFSFIWQHHPNWKALYEMGINLLALGKVKVEDDAGKLSKLSQRKIRNPSQQARLCANIRRALSDPATLAEYHVFADVISRQIPPQEAILLKKFPRLWIKCEFTPEEIEFLLGDEEVEAGIRRWYAIKERQSDWVQFLPPYTETFYHLLDIPSPLANSAEGESMAIVANDLACENKIFRDLLFEKFKKASKTPKVNAAYTVLRNPSEKADYDWMLTYNVLMAKVAALLGSFRKCREDLLKKLSKKLVSGIPVTDGLF